MFMRASSKLAAFFIGWQAKGATAQAGLSLPLEIPQYRLSFQMISAKSEAVMGGIGSGRRWQFGAETTEDYRTIDIRWLKREGLLHSGTDRRITWSRQDRVVASINIRSESGRVILTYRHKSGGEEWQDKSYPVYLDTTSCHMGGERHWFLCPARGCGRRVAILYAGSIFACRHCYRLAYPSQREKPGDRAARRADRIRDQLGWPGGILEGGGWGKPKGMHWKTYGRLCKDHDALSNRAFIEIMAHLNRPLGSDSD
jgi:hypothetical protein